MLKTNTQLIIGAVSIAFAVGLAMSRAGGTSPDATMAKDTSERSSAPMQKDFAYFPAQFVNQGKGIETPIRQF